MDDDFSAIRELVHRTMDKHTSHRDFTLLEDLLLTLRIEVLDARDRFKATP